MNSQQGDLFVAELPMEYQLNGLQGDLFVTEFSAG